MSFSHESCDIVIVFWEVGSEKQSQGGQERVWTQVKGEGDIRDSLKSGILLLLRVLLIKNAVQSCLVQDIVSKQQTTGWRRKWQPTPVFAWRIQGRRSLVGCCLWGRTESDMTSDLAAAAANIREYSLANIIGIKKKNQSPIARERPPEESWQTLVFWR